MQISKSWRGIKKKSDIERNRYIEYERLRGKKKRKKIERERERNRKKKKTRGK